MLGRGWWVILGAAIALLPARALASRECHPQGETLVCGYHCLRSVGGRWRCANTPAGSCHREENGQVTCSPEPAPPPKIGERLRRIAQCLKGRDGHVSCGYGCFENIAGHPICAQTPEGMCLLDDDRVLCSEIDASPWVVQAGHAECVRDALGDVACGYRCKVGLEGLARCAQTPDGNCEADDFGKVICSEFKPDSRIVELPDIPPAMCLPVDGGQPVCGYQCRVSPDRIRGCATTPDGTCEIDVSGRVICTQFPLSSRRTPPATAQKGIR